MALEVPPPEILQPVATGHSGSSTLFSFGMLVISVVFAVAGQFTLKSAMNEVGRIGANGDRRGRRHDRPHTEGAAVVARVDALRNIGAVLARRAVTRRSLRGLSVCRAVVHHRRSVLPALSQRTGHALRWLGVVVVAVGIAIVGLSFRGTTGS